MDDNKKEYLELEENKKPENQKIKKNPIYKTILVILCAIILISAIVVAVIFKGFGNLFKNEPGKFEVKEIRSNIAKVLETSDLNTLQYTYNGIATKYKDDKKKTVAYHTKYYGNVKLGIKFQDLDFKENTEKNTLQVTIPEVTLQDVYIDPSRLEYMFIDKSFERVGISSESLKLCEEDLINQIETDQSLFKLAKENTEEIIKGLVNPFIENQEEMTITIKWGDNNEKKN